MKSQIKMVQIWAVVLQEPVMKEVSLTKMANTKPTT
jgi:hypothetical protein